jgi:tetratricopeptide (TPR) repeat protein
LIRSLTLVSGLVVSGFGLADAQRVGLKPFISDDKALTVAVPTAISRALESIDGVVAPPPVEIGSWLARNPTTEGKLIERFDLDSLIEGDLDGKAGDYTLKLIVTTGGKDTNLSVKGKDFAALVVAADAALVKALTLKASSTDLQEMAAVERGLPSAEIAATAATASDVGKLADLEKGGENPWALAVRSLLIAQTDKPADGIPLAQRAARLAPLDANVQVMSGASLVLAQKPADARPLLDLTLKLNPAKPEAHYLLALVKLRAQTVTQDVLKDVGASFLRALQYNPRFLEAGLGLFDVYVRLGDNRNAVQVLLTLVPRMPEELRVHERVLNFLMRDDKDEGVRYLRELTRQIPDVPDTVYALATRLLNTAVAFEIVQAGELKYPSSAILPLARGQLLERQGKYDDAQKAYKTALDRDDKLERAMVLMAACLSKLGRYDEAEAMLGKTQIGKQGPKVRARMYLQSGRLERAVPILAGLSAGNDPEIPYLQGVLAMREGRFDDAQKAFEASLKVKADYAQARLAQSELIEARLVGVPKLEGDTLFRFRLGQAALDAANPLEAVTAFQAVLDKVPSNAQASFFLGVALYESGEAEDALGALQTALKGLPNNVVILTNLGAVYLDIGRYDLALENLTKATQVDAKYARGWFYLGVANFQLGYAQPAREAFLRAVGLDSNLKDQVQPFLNALPK